MHEYRTEVVIPPDRYVCLQLPVRLPEGRARVVVFLEERSTSEAATPLELDPDRQDIEWWEEFEDDRERIG